MEDLHAVGGTPAVIKMLIDAGMFDGSCMTVTGKTHAENVKDLPGTRCGPADCAAVIGAAEKLPAISRFCTARWRLSGAVAKITGKEGDWRFAGPARVSRFWKN